MKEEKIKNIFYSQAEGTCFQLYESVEEEYRRTRISHWDAVARRLDNWTGWGSYYHRRLAEVYRLIIPPGSRVIEIGCGLGDLLSSLEPTDGLGVDFSAEMIQRAARHHPQLRFINADIHKLDLEEKFDFIILSDLVNDLWDVQTTFVQLKKLSHQRTRIIINAYSKLWALPLSIVQKLGLSKPTLYQNWLTVNDIINLLNLANFEVIRNWQEILCPLPLPILELFFNRFLVKIWPFTYFALTNFIVARPMPSIDMRKKDFSVSVLIPARNEAGNIAQIFERIPKMGRGTELIFVEGHSKDDTYNVIKQTCAKFPEKHCKLIKQTGIGKGDAVRLGFTRAKGDILMILDADLTVAPEDLPRFYDALCSGKGEFVNGVRLIYPMADEAMHFINLFGNKFFSLSFTWLLGQHIKDTLCGTKVLWRKDYEKIAARRSYFGDFDPFSDFDLLFGAAKLNLKIIEVPIRYRARTYGKTNIQRWKHGWLLLKMVVFGAGKIKFV